MKKSVLIGIIVAAVVIVGIVLGIILIPSACKHDDPTKIIIVDAVAPTCQETGLTEGKKCTICGTMVVPQAVAGTIECIESDWIVDKEATHTEDGKRHTECTMCGTLFKEEILIAGNKKMEYTLLDNGTYEVSGIVDCKDKEIVIPSEYNGKAVTSIGDSAFWYCTSLTSVEIPDSVTSISEYAFNWCTSLTSINIPDSVTSIGGSAFYGCKSLTSIVIGDSVTSIGNGAFSYCTSLTSIEVDGNNKYYKSIDGNLYSKDEKTLVQYAIGKQDKSFTIPDSVTSIGDYAFRGCTSLTSIEIPDSVTSIGCDAFNGCTSLTSIEIPDSVTSIGGYAFAGCKSLTSVTIPDSVTSIGWSAFRDCTSLTSINFSGTKAQWNAIAKAYDWNYSTGKYTIYCTDGNISK